MYYYPQQQQQNAAVAAYMQPQMQPQVPQGLKGRPVSSIEEVRAAQIDFDGSLFVFPDIANKKIYTNQQKKLSLCFVLMSSCEKLENDI